MKIFLRNILLTCKIESLATLSNAFLELVYLQNHLKHCIYKNIFKLEILQYSRDHAIKKE